MTLHPISMNQTLVNSPGWENDTLSSVLEGWRGLAALQAQAAQRTGRRPLISGVRRPLRTLTMRTVFNVIAAATRLALLQALNCEDGATGRLVVADGVPASDLVYALGPWDITADDDGNWTVRELLRTGDGASLDSEPEFGSGYHDAANALVLDTTSSQTLSIASADLGDAAALEIWWRPDDDYAHGSNRYLLDGGSLELFYRASDDKFVLTDGTNTVTSAAQTFSAGDWLHICAEWGTSNGLGLWLNGSLEGSDSGAAVTLNNPTYVGSTTGGASQCEGRIEAVRFYEAMSDDKASALYGGSPMLHARWLDVLVEEVAPLVLGRAPSNLGLVTTMRPDREVRWHSRDGDIYHWDVTTSPDSNSFTVTSDDYARPVLRITPTAAKTAGYQYKRPVRVDWKLNEGFTQYPVDLSQGGFDTATLVTAGKMQSDGDDLRIYVNGVEADRWLDGMNGASTKIWINLDFEANKTATLDTALGSGTETEIVVNEDISDWPSSGLVLIGSEMFYYTSKTNSIKTFTLGARAVRGTSAAAHSSGATTTWVQHDIWMLYGYGSASAPSVDDDYKPAFDLNTSTNDSWDYDEFGDENGKRAAAWTFYEIINALSNGQVRAYGGNQTAAADPWVEIGMQLYSQTLLETGEIKARWVVYNPCGITDANFSSGEVYRDPGITYEYAESSARIRSSVNGSDWTLEDSPSLGAYESWNAWSSNVSLTSGSLYVAMCGELEITEVDAGEWGFFYLEASDVTLTLDNTYTPDASIGSEESNYALDVVIENTTTGHEIGLSVQFMALDETLEVDTENKTVTYLADGSRQDQALTVRGEARREWLRLESGSNTLKWTDSGTDDVDVVVLWDRRYIE